jgi:hypothetical protein
LLFQDPSAKVKKGAWLVSLREVESNLLALNNMLHIAGKGKEAHSGGTGTVKIILYIRAVWLSVVHPCLL